MAPLTGDVTSDVRVLAHCLIASQDPARSGVVGGWESDDYSFTALD